MPTKTFEIELCGVFGVGVVNYTPKIKMSESAVHFEFGGYTKMTINEYQIEAMKTASGTNYEHNGMLINAALGLCGEGGEVADIVKKATFQGHKLDVERAVKRECDAVIDRVYENVKQDVATQIMAVCLTEL